MGLATQDAIKQLSALMDQMDESLKGTFQNVHQGYKNETLARFLRAREGSVPKAHKMLMDCLNWRIQNEIDNILSKPIVPTDMYRAVRDSQLIGLSGYSKEGLPVFALGVGLSSFDKASVHYYVQSHIQINEYRDRIVLPGACEKYGKKVVSSLKILDMTGLKLSALSQIKLMTMISTVDDLNYPEKTETYYIVNAPYIFSACWKVVKPLLQERTRKKVKVLQGCGKDELLKIMDYDSLPHFCKFDRSDSGSGSILRSSSSSSVSSLSSSNCFSLEHPFHRDLYAFMKQQAAHLDPIGPAKLGSFHVDVPGPDPDGTESQIVKTIESELHRFVDGNGANGLSHDLNGLNIRN